MFPTQAEILSIAVSTWAATEYEEVHQHRTALYVLEHTYNMEPKEIQIAIQDALTERHEERVNNE